MNPFDWRGPEFLAFYALLGAVVLGAIALRRWYFEPDEPVRGRLTDPSSIAYLRAGKKEVLRLAVLSLLERGRLQADGTKLETKGTLDDPQLPALERVILERFERPGEARAVFADATLERECERLRRPLETAGLLPDAYLRALRWWSACAGIVLLVGVAGIKIQVALARGKTNVLFLIGLAIVFSLGAVALARLQRTPRGAAALRDLQQLLGRARQRARDASGVELALLAATFGVGALADPIRAARFSQIFPKASSSGSSGCGSGCGSAGGSSCSGGCGGGGCGGCGGS